MSTGTPIPPTQPDRLLSGQGLLLGKFIKSADGRFTLIMQADGNLVLYGPQNQPLWASGTYGLNNVFDVIMQEDGNLVIYDTNNNPLWASSTFGHPGAILIVHIDGNAVISDTSNDTLWATDTVVPATPVEPTQHDRLLTGQGLVPGNSIGSADGNYQLSMQSDANLVLYGPGDEVIWASNTSEKGLPWDVIMQDDGNLVIFDTSGASLWASDTSGDNGAMLVVEDEGLVIYDSHNKSIWSVGSPSPVATFTANSTRSQTSISFTSTRGTPTLTTISPSASGISNSPFGPSNSNQLIGGIVGGVLGGIIILLMGAFIYFLLRTRKRDRKTSVLSESERTLSGNLNTDMNGSSAGVTNESTQSEESVN